MDILEDIKKIKTVLMDVYEWWLIIKNEMALIVIDELLDTSIVGPVGWAIDYKSKMVSSYQVCSNSVNKETVGEKMKLKIKENKVLKVGR